MRMPQVNLNSSPTECPLPVRVAGILLLRHLSPGNSTSVFAIHPSTVSAPVTTSGERTKQTIRIRIIFRAYAVNPSGGGRNHASVSIRVISTSSAIHRDRAIPRNLIPNDLVAAIGTSRPPNSQRSGPATADNFVCSAICFDGAT